MLRIAGIESESIVDGPGIRYTIFTQGCCHNCKGCHNSHTHDPSGGALVPIENLYEDILLDPLLTGVTFSGGEPFLQSRELLELAKLIKTNTKLTIVTYTGYTFDQLISRAEPSDIELIKYIDMLVDGPYIEHLRNIDLLYRGSENQRLIYLDNGTITKMDGGI